jgi:hypothetical protein
VSWRAVPSPPTSTTSSARFRCTRRPSRTVSDLQPALALVDLPAEGLPGLVAGDHGDVRALRGDEQAVAEQQAVEAAGDVEPAPPVLTTAQPRPGRRAGRAARQACRRGPGPPERVFDPIRRAAEGTAVEQARFASSRRPRSAQSVEIPYQLGGLLGREQEGRGET